MPAHADLRPVVWREMERLARLGLGAAERVSPLREKFVLNPQHPRAQVLSSRPQSDGFIRADEGSLLFRDASTRLRDLVPQELLSRAMPPEKGLEFRWTKIDEPDIRFMIEAVIWLATTPVLGPRA